MCNKDRAAAGEMFQERLELARRLEEERWQREQQAARAAEFQRAQLEGRFPHAIDVPKRSVRLGTNVGTIQNGLTALQAMLGCAWFEPSTAHTRDAL